MSTRTTTIACATQGKHLLLLTGTPINSPLDAYAMIRLISPRIYRSQEQFENIHVAEHDFYGNVVAWSNLDLLRENLAVGSARLLKEDVIADLPPILVLIRK
jgi:SNF2 family DNA or RNA helicase